MKRVKVQAYFKSKILIISSKVNDVFFFKTKYEVQGIFMKLTFLKTLKFIRSRMSERFKYLIF